MKYKINSTVLLMIFTVLTNILSFGKNLVVANVFGTSSYLDVYILALFIPTLLSGLFMGSLQATLVPLTLDNIKKHGEEYAHKWYKSISIIIIFFMIVICALLIILNEPIFHFFPIGFKESSSRLFYNLSDILMVMIVFNSLIILLRNLYYIKQEYILTSVSSLIGAAVSIAYLIIIPKPDIYQLCYSLIIGASIDSMILFIFLRKYGIKIPSGFKFKDLNLRTSLGLMVPLLISASLGHANPLIDQIMASNLYEGAISSLNYADKLNSMLVQIFVMTISTTALSSFSILVSEKNFLEVKNYFQKILRIYSMVLVPITGFIILFGNQIVYILFQRGKFTEASTKLTADAWKFYALGLLFMLIGTITARIYNALKDAKVQVLISIMGLVLNIVGNYVLLKFIGHIGIALSTTITSFITTIFLVALLNKYFIKVVDRTVFKDMGKIICLNAIVFGLFYFLRIPEWTNGVSKVYTFFMLALFFVISGLGVLFLYKLCNVYKKAYKG